MPLSSIIQLYCSGQVLLVEETEVPQKNPPAISHWQTFLYKIFITYISTRVVTDYISMYVCDKTKMIW